MSYVPRKVIGVLLCFLGLFSVSDGLKELNYSFKEEHPKNGLLIPVPGTSNASWPTNICYFVDFFGLFFFWGHYLRTSHENLPFHWFFPHFSVAKNLLRDENLVSEIKLLKNTPTRLWLQFFHPFIKRNSWHGFSLKSKTRWCRE